VGNLGFPTAHGVAGDGSLRTPGMAAPPKTTTAGWRTRGPRSKLDDSHGTGESQDSPVLTTLLVKRQHLNYAAV